MTFIGSSNNILDDMTCFHFLQLESMKQVEANIRVHDKAAIHHTALKWLKNVKMKKGGKCKNICDIIEKKGKNEQIISSMNVSFWCC